MDPKVGEIAALVSGVISIALALFLFRWVLQQKNESEKMKFFSEKIQEGAATYLKRLYQVLGVLALVITVIILFVPDLGWKVAIAYVVGSACSAAAGYTGMYVSTRANARVAWAAKSGLEKALPVGFFCRRGDGLFCGRLCADRHDRDLHDLGRSPRGAGLFLWRQHAGAAGQGRRRHLHQDGGYRR